MKKSLYRREAPLGVRKMMSFLRSHNAATNGTAIKAKSKDGKRTERPRKTMKATKKHFLKFILCGNIETQPNNIDAMEERRPATVEQVERSINSGRFHNAVKELTVLQHEAFCHTICNSIEELKNQQEKVTRLYTNLWEQMSKIFHKSVRTLSSQNLNESVATAELKEAVNALVEQVNEEKKSDSETSALIPQSREWMAKWEEVVKQSVKERMCQLPQTTSDQAASSVSDELEHMGKTMKSDLCVVVKKIKPLYPENFDVCNTYAHFYIQHFSLQLNTITDYGLDENDTCHLLVWVQCIYPKEIMNHADLVHNITWEKMGPLLPLEKISDLENQYALNVVSLVEDLMKKSFDYEVKFWNEEKLPTILNTVFHSELPFDIIQMLNGQMEGAKNVSFQFANQLLPLLVEQLATFLKRYKTTFEEFVKANKKHTYFLPLVIANINSCDNYRQYIRSLENHNFKDEDKTNLYDTFREIERIGFDALLEDLFLELKPNFRKLSQKNGLCSHGTMVHIVKISETYMLKFRTLKDCYYQEIMENIHVYLVKEYIRRIMKKKVSQKSSEQQKTIANQILESASLIKECCITYGSKAEWLNDAIPKIAEIIKLQDIDAIRTEVASLAYQYPDISKHQVGAILYIKGNLKNSELKYIMNILEDFREGQEKDSPKLFSLIAAS
ncbi:tumor necrosis factor alpha-induced protein 2-like isoform X2 [Pleurodeles waltl]|uniref:tumor necrosis factor alpha-induced protein 2-like isoform X2 n=1 Tax=Pleurodeles waltl TaxID=8319 RepID=UPI0037097584